MVEFTPVELSEVRGITTARVHQLVDEGVFRKLKRGIYPAGECVRAFMGYQMKILSQKNPKPESRDPESRGLEAEQERWTRLRADREEMKVRVMTGELGNAEELIKEYEDEVIQIRSTLISIVPRTLSLLPTQKTPREREIVYRDVIRKELQAVSRDRT